MSMEQNEEPKTFFKNKEILVLDVGFDTKLNCMKSYLVEIENKEVFLEDEKEKSQTILMKLPIPQWSDIMIL